MLRRFMLLALCLCAITAMAAVKDDSDRLLNQVSNLKNVEKWNDTDKEHWKAAANELARRKEPRAIPYFITALQYENIRNIPSDCLQSMGKLALDNLLTALTKEKPAIRAAIPPIIMSRSNPRVYDALAQALKDPEPLVRSRAAFALRYSGTQAVDALITALHDPEKQVRISAAHALAINRDRRAIPALISLLGDDETVVKAVQQALARFDAPSLRPLLAEFANPDPAIRLHAMQSIKPSQDPAVIDALLSAAKDADPQVRNAAINKIADSRDLRVHPAISQALSDTELTVRLSAATMLLNDEPKAVEVLIERTKDQDANLRYQAVTTLIGNREFRLSALQDNDREICMAAVECLRKMRDPQAVQPLIKLLATDNQEEYRKVLEALAEQCEQQAIPALTHEAQTKSDDALVTAARGLAQIDDPSVVPFFVSFVLSQPTMAEYYEKQEKMKDSNAYDERTWNRQSDIDMSRTAIYEAFKRYRFPQAREALLTALRSPEATVRAKAANALGCFGPDVLSPLLNALKDPDDGVREAAASALGEIGDIAAIDPLLTLCKDNDPNIRDATLSALRNIGDRCAIPAYINALHDRIASVRYTGAYCVDGSADAISALCRLLDDPEEDVRQQAAKDLSELCAPQAVPALIKALGHRDEFIREYAARALGQTGDPRATAPLLKAMHDTDGNVILNAIDALAELHDPHAFEPLLAELRHGNPVLRTPLIQALYGSTDTRFLNVCIEIVRDMPLSQDNSAAAIAISAAGTAGFDALCTLLKDESYVIRSAAVCGIYWSDDPRALDTLLQAMHDPVFEIRIQAIEALDRRTDPRIPDALTAAMQDPDPEVGLHARRVYWSKDYPQSFDSIIAALDDEDHSIRDAAIARLATFHDPQVVERLLGMLNDYRPDVRRSACTALGKLKESRAVQSLIAIALECIGADEWSGNSASEAAIEALGEMGDQQALEPLLAILRQERRDDENGAFPAINRKAILSLAGLHDPRAVQPLLNIVSKHTYLRETAAQALGISGQEQALGFLHQAISSAKYEDRIIGAIGLCATGNPQVLPLLEKAAADPHWRVRLAVMEHLNDIKDPRVFDLYNRGLHDPDSDVSEQAVYSLGELKDLRAVPALTPFLYSPYLTMRVWAAEALEEITGKSYDKNANRNKIQRVTVVDVLR